MRTAFLISDEEFPRYKSEMNAQSETFLRLLFRFFLCLPMEHNLLDICLLPMNNRMLRSKR